MFGFERTEYDKKIYEEELADFLPDKMIDAHVHIWEKQMKPKAKVHDGSQAWPGLVAPDCTVEDALQSYKDMFPGKLVKPVLMTMPDCILEEGNPYALRCAKKENLPALYCTKYSTTKEEIRQAMKDGFCGIKPYLNHSPEYIPANEIRIYDFLPKEHLEVMNELGGIVMLHIARPGRLKDPVNLAQMMEIDEKYPNAKVIIAHIGRAYAPEDIGNAFDILKNSKNLFFDFTANTLDLAMEECIKAVGTKRLMFGSDMPIIKMRMYRIAENGRYINVIPRGLYGDVSGDSHMREVDDASKISFFMYEELRAFRRASEKLGLSGGDVEDIMCRNAANLFGMKI